MGASRGVALVALGGYGRRELSLQSDLDVLLLHDGRSDIGSIADAVWYPVWDTGVKLGHAVRTPKEALALAADDLDSMTALLQARHLAGDRRPSPTNCWARPRTCGRSGPSASSPSWPSGSASGTTGPARSHSCSNPT